MISSIAPRSSLWSLRTCFPRTSFFALQPATIARISITVTPSGINPAAGGVGDWAMATALDATNSRDNVALSTEVLMAPIVVCKRLTVNAIEKPMSAGPISLRWLMSHPPPANSGEHSSVELIQSDKARTIRSSSEILQRSVPIVGESIPLYQAVERYGLEGVVAKGRDSCYRTDGVRTWEWVKMKCPAAVQSQRWTAEVFHGRPYTSTGSSRALVAEQGRCLAANLGCCALRRCLV